MKIKIPPMKAKELVDLLEDATTSELKIYYTFDSIIFRFGVLHTIEFELDDSEETHPPVSFIFGEK